LGLSNGLEEKMYMSIRKAQPRQRYMKISYA